MKQLTVAQISRATWHDLPDWPLYGGEPAGQLTTNAAH
jgi:hypothetical protein